MAQYCRYCTSMVVGDVAYCTTKKKCMSDAAAKATNTCSLFDLNEIDAFGETQGYRPREQKKEQCDGQIKLF